MDEGLYISQPQKKLLLIEAGRKEILRGISTILLISVVFLFLRLILKMFGSNPETLFVGFIYLISDIFLIPFFGIFPQFATNQAGPSIDVTALIAIFCYTVLFTLVMIIIQVGSVMMKTRRQLNETVRKSHPTDSSLLGEMLE